MNSNKISISDIYNLPQAQVHSKIAFLKSLLNQDQDSNKEFQDHLVKTTYTVKNIGIQGTQIGISSKRLQFKQKEKCQTPINPQTHYYDNKFIPRNLFYSQPLISIKNQNKSEKAKTFDQLATALENIGTNQPFLPQQYKSTLFINRQSLKQLRRSKQILRDAKNQKPREQSFNQKIFSKKTQTQMKNIKLRLLKNKRSYAQLLKQCNAESKQIEKRFSLSKLVPLQNQQNCMFKRIMKIKSKVQEVVIDDDKRKTKSTIFLGRYSIKSRNQFTSTRKLLNSRATKDFQ